MQEKKKDSPVIAILARSDGLIWHPSFSIEEGISGSEEAVIYMGKELVALGYKVIVYGNPGTIQDDMEKDNPCYLHHQTFFDHLDKEKSFDYIVLWRGIPSFITKIKTTYRNPTNGKSPHFFFWPHDFASPGCIRQDDALLCVSGIFFLSEWQRENYYNTFPFLMGVPYIICENGLDPSHFGKIAPARVASAREAPVARSWSWLSYFKEAVSSTETGPCTAVFSPSYWKSKDSKDFLKDTDKEESFLKRYRRTIPYSVIYASNYARGLDHLLNIWPQVKDACPQATLSIYYGRQTWGSLSEIQMKQMVEKIENLKSLGVTEYGKVGHREVAKAFLKHSVWAYPCIYAETYCITAIKAAYSGCIPVVAKFAALHETVPPSAPYVNEIKTKEDLKKFQALLIRTLLESENSKKKTNDTRTQYHEWASEKTWTHTAEKWVAFWNQLD